VFLNFRTMSKAEEGSANSATVAIIIGIVGITLTLIAVITSGGANLKARSDPSTTRSLESIYTAQKAFHESHDSYVDGITLYSYSPVIKAQRSTRVYILTSDEDEFCAIGFKANVKDNRANENVKSLSFSEVIKKRKVFSIDETGKIRGEDDKKACARGFKGNVSKLGYFDYVGYMAP
jgi:hypothetical protein